MISGAAGLKLAGFVLAGGRSSRMGRDKALLPWGSTDLLQHAVDRLHALTDDVTILCGATARHAERGLPVVVDVLPDAGPLAALVAGLERLDGTKRGLFLAVDLPCVGVELLRRLCDLDPTAAAVVPVLEDGPQPLCAVYGAGCAAPARQRLLAGERRATAFWPDVVVRRVAPRELGDPAAVELAFRNVNTPGEYEAARP